MTRTPAQLVHQARTRAWWMDVPQMARSDLERCGWSRSNVTATGIVGADQQLRSGACERSKQEGLSRRSVGPQYVIFQYPIDVKC
jgi:hypothetical protein